MYDKYLVVDDSLIATDDGFSLDLRIPYYRGLGLSMVNIDAVSVDGRAVDLHGATFTVGERTYNLADLSQVDDDRWPFAQPARLGLKGQLGAGEHDVAVVINLRISYMPVATPVTARKRLALQS